MHLHLLVDRSALLAVPASHHPPAKQPHRAVLPNGVCPLGVQIPLWADAQKNKTDVPTGHRFYCVRATKKLFLPFLRMNSNSYINHGKAVYIINSAGIAYHQHEVLYIIKPQIDAR